MEEEREDWSESLQEEFRQSVRDAIKSMPSFGEYGYDDSLVAMARMRSIVAEEIAAGFRFEFQYVMHDWPKETRGDAEKIVKTITTDLSMLGLAIKHPETGQPMRLRLARTPPAQESESWFELEPIVSRTGNRPTRLPRPIPFMHLCEDPMPAHSPDRKAPER